MHTKVDFRLRKGLDADLIDATAHMTKKTLCELSRDGLRLMLGILTTKESTVIERPISIPVVHRNIDEPRSISVPGKPAISKPKKG